VALALVFALLVGCGGTPEGAVGPGVLNIYNWSDYIGVDTVRDFERETGIEVRYDVFDSNELLEAKLLAGGTGFDLVMPSASFIARQIEAGVFQPLDLQRLPGRAQLDPALMKLLASYDPGNRHALPWLWGTTGIGYNARMIAERMPDAPLESWKLLLDPEVLARFADCGVALLDTPSEVLPIVLHTLGLPSDSQDPAHLAAAEALLARLRPHIRYFHSSQYINDLANGELCLVLGWSGDILIARDRAREAKTGHDIVYRVPREGSLVWIDTVAMPRDAPNVENAYRFLEYILRPEVAAGISNHVRYANANTASTPQVDSALRDDPGVYPNDATRASLFPNAVNTSDYERLVNRTWLRLKQGS
jgi:putrescine transport system substrate-binding protein